MSTQVQFRRGTTLETTNFTGASGEVTVDTTKNVCVVHDASKAGGYPLMREDGVNSALALGSPANCSLKFVNNPGTGIYSPGVDQVAIATAGVQRFLIDSSGNTTYANSLTATSFIPTGSSAPINGLYLPGANKVALSTAGIGRLFVDASGNVGIGTTSPGQALSVVGNIISASTGTNYVASSSNGVTTSYLITDTSGGNVQVDGAWPIRFTTNGNERARIDSSGRLLVGTSSARSNYFNTSSIAPSFQIEGTTYSTSSISLIANGNTATVNPASYVILCRTRGTSVGSTTVVSSGDMLGGISYQGSDGTEFVEAGSILCEVDGTPGANDMPGRLVFSTTADGASSPTERMRITNDGKVGIGTLSPVDKLHVDGRIAVTTDSSTPTTGEAFFYKSSSGAVMSGFSASLETGSAGSRQERLRVTSDGKVGIGTSSPDGRLEINDQSNGVETFPLWVSNQGAGVGTRATIRFDVANSYYGSIGGGEEIGIGSSVVIDAPGTGGVIRFTKNNKATEIARFDSLGSLGIGTSSPNNTLHVAGTGSTQALFERIGSNGAFIGLKDGSANNVFLGNTNGVFSIQTPGSSFSDKLVVTSAGLVGIGTGSPNRLFESSAATVDNFARINTTGATKSGIEFASGGTVYSQLYFNNVAPYDLSLLQQYSTGSLILGTNNTERARIDSSGRLLVGATSTSSSALLQVQGNSSSSTGEAIVQLRVGKTNANILSGNSLGSIQFSNTESTVSATIEAVADANWNTTNDYPSRLVFSTTADGASTPTERMRIGNDGVTNIFSSGSSNFVPRSSAAANTSNFFIQGCYGATNTQNGTVSFQVFTNGNVQNTNNSYAGISDIKLKENIVDASSQWSDIKALQVRKYNFKEGQTHTQIGLVAQEVELVSPGLVTESPDRDEYGNDLGTVTKSVNYSVLYMKAVKALQEAMERIETLEAKVAALESK